MLKQWRSVGPLGGEYGAGEVARWLLHGPRGMLCLLLLGPGPVSDSGPKVQVYSIGSMRFTM